VLPPPVQPLVQGVLETVLYVEDLDRAERFYVDLLGFRKLSAEKGRHVFLRAGGSVLLLFVADASLRSKEVPPHGARGPGHTCFVAPEPAYAAWKAHLAGHNVPLLREQPWPGGGRSFYFEDPSGNVLEIADRDFWPE
jgi:catechol 2,3-dioxygenase-like lactoylglutathione lyase family enzyme